MKLHHRQIANLPKGRHADGGGLRFESNGMGSGKWTVRFSTNGKKREKGLGVYPDVTLKSAREAAQAAREAARKGIDTTKRNRTDDAPQPLPDSPTFGQLAESYFALHVPALKINSQQKHRRLIELHILSHFGDREVASLAVFDLHKVYGPRLLTHFKSTKNTLEGLSSLLAFGRRAGLPCSELIMRDFRAERVFKTAAQKYENECQAGEHSLASLSYQDFAETYQALGEERIDDLAAKFVILTCARRQSVMLIERAQYDGPDLHMTALQMKGNKPHVYPLCDEARRIADLAMKYQTDSPLLFPVGKKAILRQIRRANAGANLHGTRHAISSFCEDFGISDSIADEMLAHAGTTSTRRKHYLKKRNFEPIRAAYTTWAKHLTTAKITRLKAA